jgi:hypothetical protein
MLLMSRARSGGAWRRQRPFVGALLIAAAGVETFFSTQLDIGNMHVQLGIEGFQATVIPVGFVLLSALVVLMPQHRIFYGVITLALSLYSIVGVNLGGFIIGMLLSAVGGILAVSWAPPALTEGAPVPPTAPTIDGELHAEFAPYSKLVALANASRSDRVTA